MVRFTAPKDIRAFLQGEESFWGIEIEVVEPRDFLLECVMMGLRLAGGISEAALRFDSARASPELFPGLWEGWVARGLAVPPDGSLRLTTDGLLLLDRPLGEVFQRELTSSPEQMRVRWH